MMATGATPLQPLPPWMSWTSVTVPVPTGGFSISFGIVNLPLTYYGPSIPLGTEGPWTWGGLTSPAPTSLIPSSTTPFPPSTITSTTATPSSTATTPTATLPPSSLSSTSFPSSSSTSLTVTPPTSTGSSSVPSLASSIIFSSSSLSTTATASSTSSIAPVQGHHHLSHGALAGIIVGSVIGGLALLGLLCLCLWLSLRPQRQNRPSPQATGDSSFGGDVEDHGEWQIVVPRSSGPSGPSGSSGAAGSGRHDASIQGSGDSRLDTVHYGEALAQPNVGVAGGVDPTGRLSWPPWRRGSGQRYQDVPVAEEATPDIVRGQDVVSPPLSPRSVQYSDGHNSDAERETLLHPATVAPVVAAVNSTLESPNIAASSRGGRFAERAREAVAQRNARQRASYTPGAAGFFTWFRNSWASSRRASRTPGPSTDELGFRPRSEKSAPGSKVSSTRGNSRGPAHSQRSKQSSAKSEKSELIPPQDSDESPPTPHSSQFPTPPPTHLEAHALVRQLSQASSIDRRYRTASAYSAGGSVSSGNTVYYDAMDAPPLPSPLSPHALQSRPETSVRLVLQPTNRNAFATEMGELAESSSSGSELLPPPPIRDIQPRSPLLVRPPASLRSLYSSLRSLAYQADDVLDEPPPLPSASLDDRGHSISSSPPPSYTDLHHPPPGLEEYSYDRMPAFDRPESHTTRTTTDLVDVLEEGPPSSGSQWRRIAGGDEPLPFEDRLTPPVRVTTHFRSSSVLEYSSYGALTPPRAASVHSAPLLPHNSSASFSGRRISSRAPSSSGGRRGTSLISRKSSRSHSPWSRTSHEGRTGPATDGLTRMPSLGAFGNRPSPPPLDEYVVGEARPSPLVQPPSQSRPPSITRFGYAV